MACSAWHLFCVHLTTLSFCFASFVRFLFHFRFSCHLHVLLKIRLNFIIIQAHDIHNYFTGKNYVNNGAAPIRISSILIVIFGAYLTASAFTMMGLKGKGEQEGNWSLSLVVLAVLQFFAAAISLGDCVMVFEGTVHDNVPLAWEWQHKAFRRIAGVAGITTIILLPLLFNFVLNSRGDKFFTLMDDADTESKYRRLVWMHITSFLGLLFFSVVTIYWSKFTINGLQNRRGEVILHLNKLASWNIMAILIGGATVLLGLSSIEACHRATNSGVVAATIAYSMTALPVLMYCGKIIASAHRKAHWYSKFRSILGAHMFVSYMCFWWILMLLVFEATGAKEGFWGTVEHFNDTRQSLVHLHLYIYILLVVCVSVRVFFHKMRKKWRMEKKGGKVNFENFLDDVLNAVHSTVNSEEIKPLNPKGGNDNSSSCSSDEKNTEMEQLHSDESKEQKVDMTSIATESADRSAPAQA